MKIRAVTLAIAVALGGCSFAPAYQRPAATIPAEWKDPAWKTAQPADALPRGAWWRLYGDPVLDDLIARVDGANQTVQQAAAQVRVAQSIMAQQRAQWFPSITASPSVTRSRAANVSGVGASVLPAATIYNLPVNATWEADLWGRIGNSVEATAADVEASAADLANARLAAYATLAQNYFALRTADLQRDLLESTVAAYQRSLDLTRNRYQAGVAAKVDIVQAEVQLKSAQAQLVDAGVDRALRENAIATLVGVPPAQLRIVPAPWQPRVPDVPPALPSALLERRPDIASAERTVRSANARIGVARAAYFPALTISAGGGFRSNDLSDWISVPTRFWSLGAALAQSIFDGGQRRAVTAQAEATYDAQVARYRATVLTGFQDVENQLATLRILEDEIRLQEEVVAGARTSVELTTNQYKAGVTSFLNVLTAQTTQLSAERTLLSLVTRRVAASVSLVQALGGGWDQAEIARAR